MISLAIAILAIAAIYKVLACFLRKMNWLSETAANGWALIIAIVVWVLMRPHIGFQEPGHWFERSEYTTQVPVNIFPEGHSSKNYRVVGTVHARHYDTGDSEVTGSTRYYALVSAKFPNGGTVYFEDAQIPLHGTERAYDASGRYWTVEFAR